MDKPERSESRFTIILGAVIFGLGLVFNILMFLGGGWLTGVFFIIMGIGAFVMLLGVWARRNWVFRARPPGWVKRHIGLVAVLFLLSIFVLSVLFVNKTEHRTYPMTWSYGEPSERHSTLKHIVLTFVDYPNYYVGIWSSDLHLYLERLPTKEMPVVFRVTTDFGNVRAYQEIQIGELKKWDESGGHGGRIGNYDPKEKSPWD